MEMKKRDDASASAADARPTFPRRGLLSAVSFFRRAKPAMEGEYVSESEELPGYGPLHRFESEEVFAPGRPAMVISAGSGEGKTVGAVCMAYVNRAITTGFTYITNSYDTPANKYLRDMIPSICVKNWDIDMICSLWGDILRRSLAIGRCMSDDSIERFIQGRCAGDSSLRASLDAIDRTISENMRLFPDGESLTAAAAAHKRLAKVEFIRSRFKVDDPNLSDPEVEIVRACRSSRPLHVLILDDVTANLRTPPTGDLFIPTVRESGEIETVKMKGKRGFEFLLINVLTLARHHAIVGIFVHTLDAFEAPIRQQFGSMMCMGQDAVDQCCRLQTLSPADKDLLVMAWNVAKRYKHHKIVFYTNPEMAPRRQRVGIIKPTYFAQRQEIGTPTYRALLRNIEAASVAYKQSLAQRTQVEIAKKRLEAESEALAREGSGAGSAPPTLASVTDAEMGGGGVGGVGASSSTAAATTDFASLL